jgi:hypothetical protein
MHEKGGSVSTPERTDPTTVERMRRVVRTWRALEPTEAEVRAARVRVQVGPRGRRPWRAIPGAVALAILVAASVAFGGGLTVWRTVFGDAHRVDGPSVVPRSLPAAGSAGSSFLVGTASAIASAVAPEIEMPRSSPVATRAKSVSPSAESASSSAAPPLAARAAVVAQPEPNRGAPGGALPSPTSLAADGPSGGSAESSSAAPFASQGASGWTAAAEAMRAHDYGRAELAFDALARSPQPRTRDEARLARAQVWLAEGRTSEARPELVSLAETGATWLVRQRAADALRALP